MKPRWLLKVFLLLLLCLPALGQERQMRIFELSNRPSESTVEMVRPLLSPDGTVLSEHRLNKLIVTDTPEVLAEVERLLEQIDQPAPHVRIFVRMDGVRPWDERYVGVGVNNAGVGVAAQQSSGMSSTQAEQNLVVMSGERAIITMGRELATPLPYYQFAQNWGLISPGFVFRTVSTGFAVEPLVVGEVVRMTITPWLGFVGDPGRHEVLFNETSTTVALRSGQSATISSGGSTQEAQAQAFGLIFASGRSTGGQQGSITVRPVIQDF